MKEATSYLIGRHDFASFCGSGAQVKTTIRTITSMDVWRDGDMVTIRVSGTGFLYNMVRIISGTLIEIETDSILRNGWIRSSKPVTGLRQVQQLRLRD